jgi:hypothetical protein
MMLGRCVERVFRAAALSPLMRFWVDLEGKEVVRKRWYKISSSFHLIASLGDFTSELKECSVNAHLIT